MLVTLYPAAYQGCPTPDLRGTYFPQNILKNKRPLPIKEDYYQKHHRTESPIHIPINREWGIFHKASKQMKKNKSDDNYGRKMSYEAESSRLFQQQSWVEIFAVDGQKRIYCHIRPRISLAMSPLLRNPILELLLLRRWIRDVFGSAGLRPLARA